MKRVAAALRLAARFARALLVSGWQTVVAIMRASGTGGPAPTPVFLRVRFAPMSEAGAALLGCMVSLTPGTTTLDIDMSVHELLLHVLDGADPAAVVQGIRDDFEPDLITLFGRSS